MPNIIGPFDVVISSMEPIEAHAAYLRHLSSVKVARRLIQEKFGFTSQDSRQTSTILSSHVGQALQFHEESLKARRSIRPMLQYYCYLNLAVAVVLAYRPPNFNQYRQHGVEDKSHALTTLDLRSVLVQVRRGAVPLFHSLMSGENIQGRKFRLNELAGCIPLVRYELEQLFDIYSQQIMVDEEILKDKRSGLFHSQIQLQCLNSTGSKASLSRQSIGKAMPDLVQHYTLTKHQGHTLVYRSQQGWKVKSDALKKHKSTCMRLINYGGHYSQTGAPETFEQQYQWHGIARKGLLPTLSAALLLSFGLASISRYRPALARRIEGSEINVLLDVFVAEADAIVIPAMRNLLYREEVVITSMAI